MAGPGLLRIMGAREHSVSAMAGALPVRPSQDPP